MPFSNISRQLFGTMRLFLRFLRRYSSICCSIVLVWILHKASQKSSNHDALLSNNFANTLGYSYGSLIAPLHNRHNAIPLDFHVKTATDMRMEAGHLRAVSSNQHLSEDPITVCIVTPELAGLHKNGGIGTAFLELALLLAAESYIRVTVLIAHPASRFPPGDVVFHTERCVGNL